MSLVTERHILHIHFHFSDGSDPELYGRLIEQLEGISPHTQALPPNEADCDVSGSLRYFDRDARQLAQLVRLRALALHGINATIGSRATEPDGFADSWSTLATNPRALCLNTPLARWVRPVLVRLAEAWWGASPLLWQKADQPRRAAAKGRAVPAIVGVRRTR
ncbi:hypothetical protein ACWDZ6_21610 [Streptomyces sp. NPDC002926]